MLIPSSAFTQPQQKTTSHSFVCGSYLFVYTDTDGTFGYVEYYTRSAMVIFERHALVDGGINFNINIIATFECT